MEQTRGVSAGGYRHFVLASGTPGQRLAGWQDALKVSGRVEIAERDLASFEGTIRSLALNELMATEVSSGDFRFLRDTKQVERVVRDHVFVNYIAKGRASGRMADRAVRVETGSLLVTRQRVTMDIAMQGATWFGLLIPFERFRRHTEWRPSMEARVFVKGSPEAVILGAHLRSLLELPDDLSAAQMARVARASLDLVVTHLGAATREEKSPRGPDSVARDNKTLAVKRIIVERLDEPGLGPDLIRRELNLSRSQLYRLTSEGPGIAASIRRLRLLCIHRDIASGRHRDRTIEETASRWGLLDARSFRRAFANEFGYTPSALRERTLSQSGESMPDHTDAAAEIERWFSA